VTDKVKILMVDDQPSKLLSYEAILAELGENLIKANSSREALDHLLRHEIAVVLMDVSMPDMDGFDLADMIRQHPRYQRTAIIFVSAVHLTDLDKLKGYARGAVDYISVPVVPELLRAKVSVFAELHRKAEQTENLNAELRRLSSVLITTQDEERRRIARDLHDGLGQDLTAVKLMVESILQNSQTEQNRQTASDLRKLTERMIEDIRNMSYLLHPPMLDEIGLNFALSWYLEGFSKRSGINTQLEVEPREFPRLPPDLETAIFRVVQEAMTNVFRHAKAQRARVQLSKGEKEVVLIVEDDGSGVSEDILECRPGSVGVGIAGMKQRVKEFGGDLQLRNAEPGTVIEATIPLPCESQAPSFQSLTASPLSVSGNASKR
jgi:signal transduction histidine kinase